MKNYFTVFGASVNVQRSTQIVTKAMMKAVKVNYHLVHTIAVVFKLFFFILMIRKISTIQDIENIVTYIILYRFLHTYYMPIRTYNTHLYMNICRINEHHAIQFNNKYVLIRKKNYKVGIRKMHLIYFTIQFHFQYEFV